MLRTMHPHLVAQSLCLPGAVTVYICVRHRCREESQSTEYLCFFRACCMFPTDRCMGTNTRQNVLFQRVMRSTVMGRWLWKEIVPPLMMIVK